MKCTEARERARGVPRIVREALQCVWVREACLAREVDREGVLRTNSDGRVMGYPVDPATGQPRLYGGFYTQETVREIVAYAAGAPTNVVNPDVLTHARPRS